MISDDNDKDSNLDCSVGGLNYMALNGSNSKGDPAWVAEDLTAGGAMQKWWTL